MKSKVTILSLSVLLLFALLGGPQIAMAQQPTTSNTGTTEPPQALPNAPSAQAAQTSQPSNAQQTSPQKPDQNPLGAAAAQQGVTAGGAASRPAGNAIAPAKQRQMRSFLIKLGAIAAGGAAIGTVVALSRGTKSTPPGSGR